MLPKRIKGWLTMGSEESGGENTGVEGIERRTDMPGVSELLTAYGQSGEININRAEADLDRSDNTRSVLSSDE